MHLVGGECNKTRLPAFKVLKIALRIKMYLYNSIQQASNIDKIAHFQLKKKTIILANI